VSRPLLCIAGKNQVAVDILKHARSVQGIDLVALPTSVDRGFEGWQPSLFRAAERLGVPIAELDALMEQPNLVFVSAEYDKIIRVDRFRSPALFNMHFSLLPKYRGCNTAIWPILNGEAEHGVSLHVIDPGVDTGDIIAQASFPIEGLNARDLYFRCMELGRDVVIDALPSLLDGTYVAVPQREEDASLYRRRDLDFSLKHIDLSEPAELVMRRIRAFTFPEYQRPMLDGMDIVAAEIASTASKLASRPDSVVVETADLPIRLVLAPPNPDPIGLRQSGYVVPEGAGRG
jgi:methionyl-tRNA formyltransferase